MLEKLADCTVQVTNILYIHKSVYEYLLARYLMTTNWLEVQKLTSTTQLDINGLEQTYNNSIARLLATEPSVFSFIRDFARPHVRDKPFSKITNSPQSENQPQNLYNIFLELLRWNENKLALTMITEAKYLEEESQDETLEELTGIFKKLLLTNDEQKKICLTASYHGWSPPQSTTPEKAPIFISWQLSCSSRIPLNTLTVRFLNLVGCGAKTEVEDMLKVNPKLTQVFGDLTDCSGRTWYEITAFQYAVLALDFYMWRMLKKYLDEESLHAQLEEPNKYCHPN